ncbi:DNA repair protein RecN [Alkalibacter saccharofermentans]|uniref:DNA repair protein RecN n=1 Tax=Alkalibacter saccharofermentans DSM 14828 TaxID=1120975 RepID=A0A1M4UGJ6_9FIRM|nr:DNA repair protein RecN [Alkalibacter saccharofermentans]SHE55703.1 DNA replication and repair protein RecN [Alkalibacter saccharofermentans DSM 14828]
MLAELNIKNFALIENVMIEFYSGFNVITGETGAGKSIILNALMLSLGARGNKDMIRKGKDRLLVQAMFVFEKLPGEIAVLLDEMGGDENGQLILSRELHSSGRNVCRVNGILVNVNDLKKIGDRLVDIHSQRDHNLLLNRDEHVKILDAYGREKIKDQKKRVSDLYDEWIGLKRQREELLKSISNIERELDILKFQLNEISEVGFHEEEDEELEKRIKVLENSEILFNHSNQAYEWLYSGDASVMDQLGKSKKSLEDMGKVDISVRDLSDRLGDVMANLEDIAYSIRDYKEKVVFDDYELNDLQAKLNKLILLKRKYGPELNDVADYKIELMEKIDQIEKRDIFIDELDKGLETLKGMYLEQALVLSDMRKEAGRDFSRGINAHLGELAMENARFKVVTKTCTEEKCFTRQGIDDLEFHVRTNVGDEDKPLVKIASGGEVSRLMLAVKSAISTEHSTSTLIFDEIDTGISGNAAGAVGKKLKELGMNHQIISITHLPQIASMAAAHFEVVKKVEGSKTKTLFNLLDEKNRIRVIATMIDGSQSQKSLDHAQEILVRNSSEK